MRKEGAIWAVVAQRVRIVQLAGLDGDIVDLSVVDGERELTIDGERTIRPLPGPDRLAGEHESVVLHAERVDGDLLAVDVFPL